MINKLKTTTFLAKVTTFSSYLWLLFTGAFVYVIFASTKMFTLDPSYGPGSPQNVWLLPMLTTLFLGCAFLGLTFLGGILRKVLKAPKWNAPLGFGAGKADFGAFLVLGAMFLYMVAALRGGVGFGGEYSGQEIFDAVNAHRVSIGVKPVTLGQGLCDNLVERWRYAKDGKFHEGFEDWVKNEGIQTEYGYGLVGEILVTSPTVQNAIYWWSTSPGHKDTLERPDWDEGCAYAAEGTTVMTFGIKK